ncbi:MAG TPA: ABC transporter permease, partial [Saprospiraceae bacterium]|nr:ABC transporter permease [Saprospiraceae bacterium]
ALRNAATAGVERGITLRKGLIVMQFAVAQALLIGAVVTVVQLDFLQKMDIGVSKDLVLNARFNNDSLSLSKLDFLKSRLLQIPTVETVSFSTDEPTSGNTWATNMAFGRGEDEPFSTTTKFTDGDFAKTYGLQMVAGRWYENSDTVREYVVNESLLRKVGITAPADAIGQEMRLGGGRFRRICGVVKDFHTQSAHVRSRHNDPLVMAPRKRVYSHLSVKIKSGDAAKTKEEIQKVYDAAFPEQVFDPTFFDEMLASFYEKEAQFSAFARGIALLAVLIGCLGLFGLASHMAVRRTKEIGVRKVLGASVAGITGLLAKDFLKLVVVAIVVASPIAYYFMKKWLSDFAYRIDIQW